MNTKIFTVIKRNLQIYTNSKLSFTIFLLGPIILILLVGATLQDTSLKNISVSIFMHEEDSATNSFIDRLHEKSFNVIQTNSLEECKQNVIDGNTQACINLEKVQDTTKSVSENFGNYDVNLYVDFSKQRTVWGIIGSIQTVVDEESNHVRETLINNLKTDFNRLTSSIINAENRLNLAINSAEIIERELEEIQQNQVENQIDGITEGITPIINDLNLILNSGLLGEPYYSQLSEIINDLRKIRGDLESLELNIKTTLENQINRVAEIKNQLITARNSLNTLKNMATEIENANIDRLTNPIILNYKPVSDEGQEGYVEKRLEFIDYLFPSFVMFFIVFSSIIFSSTVIMKERMSNSYVRNIVSGTSGFSFIAGNFFTALMLIIIQIAIIAGIAIFFVNLNLIGNLAPMVYILLISISIFTLVGILIGYIFDSYETSIIASISIALLFFIFSPTVTPAETLPTLIASIIKFSPLVLLETKLRITLIFNNMLKINLFEIISLVSVSIISLILIFGFYKKSKEKEI